MVPADGGMSGHQAVDDGWKPWEGLRLLDVLSESTFLLSGSRVLVS